MENLNMIKKKEILAAILIGVITLIVYGYRVGFPESMYYDEVYHVKTAREFLALSGNTDTVHPPLGKILIAASMRLLGDHSWVWRLVPLLAGTGSVIVLFFIALRLTKRFPVACLAAFLFLVDGMSITQARIAMLNAAMLLFMLLSFYMLIPYAVNREWPRKRAFCLSGIAVGLAISTRWVSMGILSVVGILLIAGYLAEKKAVKPRSLSPQKIAYLPDLVIYYGLIPLAIYLAAHIIIPVIYHHPSTFPQFLKVASSAVWKYQTNMLSYHLHLKEGHNYGSAWWSWPLMTRPIWYYYQKPAVDVHGILCIGNPLIFWAIPLTMGYTLWRLIREKSLTDLLIATGFFAQWLPWALVSRVKFFHYFYATMPFVALATALFLERLWRTGRHGRWAAILYLAAVTGMFIYWYPLYNGMPITEIFFRQHMWFHSWI